MASLKEQLIKLGYAQPNLREHLKVVIGQLEKKAKKSLKDIAREFSGGERMRLMARGRPMEVGGIRTTVKAHLLVDTKELMAIREFRRKVNPALMKAVKERGWTTPVHVIVGKDNTMMVAEGNHRVALANEMGIEKLPVIVHFRNSAKGQRLVDVDEDYDAVQNFEEQWGDPQWGKISQKKMANGKIMYHATGFRSAKLILDEREMGSFERSRISFSSEPQYDFGTIVIGFAPGIASKLIEIKYDEKWLYRNPKIAEYIVEEDDLPYVDPWENEHRWKLELAEKASEYWHEKEWVSRVNFMSFQPSDVVEIRSPHRNLLESLTEFVRNRPEYDHVKLKP